MKNLYSFERVNSQAIIFSINESMFDEIIETLCSNYENCISSTQLIIDTSDKLIYSIDGNKSDIKKLLKSTANKNIQVFDKLLSELRGEFKIVNTDCFNTDKHNWSISGKYNFKEIK